MIDIRDSFCTIAYKGQFIHTCQNRTTSNTEIRSQIGYCINNHKTIIGAKRYITKDNQYRPPK
jgi:hypothetical protein